MILSMLPWIFADCTLCLLFYTDLLYLFELLILFKKKKVPPPQEFARTLIGVYVRDV